MTATIAEVKAAGGYKIVYADPAWKYSDKGCNGAADKHYSTMSTRDLCRLKVPEIAAEEAVLFLWVVNPLLPDAFRVIESWGFKYKTKAFEWIKTNKTAGTEFLGLGHWTRGNTESCLLATRGRFPPRPVAKGIRQLVWAEEDIPEAETVVAPVGRHSAKPTEVRDRIVELMGDLPRIELFARDRAPGWDCWGNETTADIKMESYTDAA